MSNFRDPRYGVSHKPTLQPEIVICKLCRHHYLKTGGCSNPDCENFISLKEKEKRAAQG